MIIKEANLGVPWKERKRKRRAGARHRREVDRETAAAMLPIRP